MRRLFALVALVAVPVGGQDIGAPLDFVPGISSGVGSRSDIPGTGGKDGRFHKGIDIPVPVGTPVLAVARGTIVEHWPDPDGYYKGHDTFGGYIVILHCCGSGVHSAYAHLSETFVNTGEYVAKGDVIGLSGNSGVSTGPHLHFELFIAGDRVFGKNLRDILLGILEEQDGNP